MNILVILADAISALVLGPIVMPAMLVTHTQVEVCAAMHGTYDAKAPDQCKDGHWAALVPLLKEAVPQPKK
jgi:hypothetical protein